jgi:proline iminopeptidase
MRMFVKPRILSQSKYTMKNKQSRFVFSISRSIRAHMRLAKLTGSETQTTVRTDSLYQSSETPSWNSELLRASAPEGIKAQVADLEALRARLGYNKIDLIGHSWGGDIVMAYASAYPQHIQHLILIDSAVPNWANTVFLFDQVFPDQLAEEDKIEKGNDAVAKSSGEELRRFLARDFYSQKRFQQLIGKLSSQELGKVEKHDINEAVNKALKNSDLTDDLKRFTFPTLVMWGRFDMNVAVLTGWKISQAIPGAKMVIYEKSGHFPFYEQESSFLRDLNQFLSDSSGSRQ